MFIYRELFFRSLPTNCVAGTTFFAVTFARVVLLHEGRLQIIFRYFVSGSEAASQNCFPLTALHSNRSTFGKTFYFIAWYVWCARGMTFTRGTDARRSVLVRVIMYKRSTRIFLNCTPLLFFPFGHFAVVPDCLTLWSPFKYPELTQDATQLADFLERHSHDVPSFGKATQNSVDTDWVFPIPQESKTGAGSPHFTVIPPWKGIAFLSVATELDEITVAGQQSK